MSPARSSTFRCFETAGWLMRKGFASSITPASPQARRARIARRVGSARAPKVSLRFALTLYRTIRLYNAEPFTGCAPGGQARRGRGAAALARQTGIHQHRQCMLTETPRLRLRPLADADAPFILELLNDPDFLSNVGDRGVRNLQDARRYIEAGPAAGHRRHGFGLCAVALKAYAADAQSYDGLSAVTVACRAWFCAACRWHRLCGRPRSGRPCPGPPSCRSRPSAAPPPGPAPAAAPPPTGHESPARRSSRYVDCRRQRPGRTARGTPHARAPQPW